MGKGTPPPQAKVGCVAVKTVFLLSVNRYVSSRKGRGMWGVHRSKTLGTGRMFPFLFFGFFFSLFRGRAFTEKGNEERHPVPAWSQGPVQKGGSSGEGGSFLPARTQERPEAPRSRWQRPRWSGQLLTRVSVQLALAEGSLGEACVLPRAPTALQACPPASSGFLGPARLGSGSFCRSPRLCPCPAWMASTSPSASER